MNIESRLYNVGNALVICNHGHPPPENTGDFDFLSSKSPQKALPCGDCSVKLLLFSPAACYLSPLISTAVPCSPPRGAVVTND